MIICHCSDIIPYLSCFHVIPDTAFAASRNNITATINTLKTKSEYFKFFVFLI